MKHCLVVDDSRVIRKVACRIFGDLNFETEEAEDNASALEVCRHKMPDLILLDETTPAASGFQFLRALRKEPFGQRPVVVYCVTEKDLNHITEALGAGANDYILKPFDRAVIQAKLADVGLA